MEGHPQALLIAELSCKYQAVTVSQSLRFSEMPSCFQWPAIAATDAITPTLRLEQSQALGTTMTRHRCSDAKARDLVGPRGRRRLARRGQS
jgi:hypothetical protein